MGFGTDRIKRMFEHHDTLELKTGTVGLIGVPSSKSSVGDAKNPRDIIVTATTDDVDMDDEVVLPGGADMEYYSKNRANFLDHLYDFGKHVASMRSIKMADDRRSWINRSVVFDGLKSPYADDLLAIATQVGIGASIGFEALEGGPPMESDPIRYKKARYVVRRWRMVELSFTAMPCNVSCRTMQETGGYDEGKMAALDEMVTKSQIKLKSAVAVGFVYRKTVAVSTPPRVRRSPPVVVFDF